MIFFLIYFFYPTHHLNEKKLTAHLVLYIIRKFPCICEDFFFIFREVKEVRDPGENMIPEKNYISMIQKERPHLESINIIIFLRYPPLK